MKEESPAPSNASFPGWEAFVQALRERTLAGGDDPDRRVDTGAVYYPLIGAALGVAALVVDRAAAPCGPALAGAAIVATWALLSRGRSLLGPGRTLAAALQPDPVRTFAVLESPARAPVILVAAALAVAETMLLASLDHFRDIALLFAPMLGHCAMVVTAAGSRQARADDRAVKFSPALTFREFGIASTITFAAVFLTTNFLGLLMVLVTGLATIGLRLLLHYRFGGVQMATLAAVGEIVQWSVIALLVGL